MSRGRRRAGRSTRGYVIEFGLAAIAIAAIYLFLAYGGPRLVGPWLAGMFAP